MDQDHRDYLMALGHCFLQNGHTLEAAVVFRGVAALWPNDFPAQAALAYALAEAGHPQAALDLIDDLLGRSPPEGTPSFLHLLRRKALWKLGRREALQGDVGQGDAGQGDAGQGDAGQGNAGQDDAGVAVIGPTVPPGVR